MRIRLLSAPRVLLATAAAPCATALATDSPAAAALPPHGTYLIRTRAIDLAGNVQSVRTQRLKLG